PICQLRASVRRTSGRGFGLSPKGWTTPMAGWRTPSGSDGEGGTMDVLMAMREGYTPKLKLRDQAPLASGTMQSGSPAPMERRGALNPALSLWLMGYPDEWLSCGVRAMQSSQSSRRVS